MMMRLRKSAPLLVLCLVPLLGGCAEMSAFGESRPSLPPGITPVYLSSTRKILYIGDSLSVGSFGEGLQSALIAGAGRGSVAVYASCGSAANHWLASEPPHTTVCGYRETTPTSRVFEDYHNGVKPHPMPTPKIEPLLRKHHPTMVIVQLGTNHYDPVVAGGRAAVARQEEYFERLANAILRTNRGEVQQVIWILPPDSSHFSKSVQSAVADAINRVAQRHHFSSIDSRSLTHYVNGKTGGDGIHYNTEAGLDWAAKTIREINRLLLPRVRVNGKST